MKSRIVTLSLALIFLGGVTYTATSCKWLAKTFAKHWTRKQKKKFIAKCKEGAVGKFSDRANEICKCMATVAEEKYPEAEDAIAMNWLQLARMAADCLKE